ncbi:amidohydrolase family protein, partial [candidate division KSB1 bacterium]
MKKIHFIFIVGLALIFIYSIVNGQFRQRELKLLEGEIHPDKLLLKDYQPKYLLKVKETEITKAKFPVIDVHMHARADRNPDDWVKTTRSVNIKKSIIFCGTGDRLKETYDKFIGKYPDDFIVFCGIGLRGALSDPDYSQKAVKALEEAHSYGVRGVGELVDKGFGWGKDSKGNQVDIDHPMFDPVWEKCGELNMPVNVHVFDPVAFYTPVDRFNEQFLASARFHHYGRKHHSRDVMIEKRNKILRKHRKTIFIGAHIGNAPHNLAELSKILDENPNFYVDLSAR